MLDYRCESCIHQQLYKRRGRVCFLFEQIPGTADSGHASGFTFRVPVLEDNGLPATDPFNNGAPLYDQRHLDSEGFLEILWDLSERMPHLSAYQILAAFFGGVCPTAFFDEVVASLIACQRSVSDYKIDISNASVRTEVMGFYMTLGDTLEAFDIIVAAKNAYERYELDQQMKNTDQGGKGGK